MKEETKHWLETAEGDFEVGSYAHTMARYAQAIYMLCQAIEKILKGAKIELTHQVPKKIHRLEILAQESGITFSKDQYQTLMKLSIHYAKVRYPDFAQNNYSTKAKTEELITIAKEMYLWILKALKNH